MHAWIFRNRARLKLLYGLEPAASAGLDGRDPGPALPAATIRRTPKGAVVLQPLRSRGSRPRD